MTRRFFAFVLAPFMALTMLAGVAHAAKSEIYTGRFSDTAVQGYDTVAFFTEGKAVEGSEQFETEFKGTTWRFASQENLDLFLADPDKYRPQYGGYCAWAAAQGYTAKGAAQHWNIVDGKLYLNFNADVKSKWEADIPGFITQADANWPGILD